VIRGLMTALMVLTSITAMADVSIHQVRTQAALFRYMDDKFNSHEKPCESLVPGFAEEFARSKVSQEPGYSKFREIGAEELAKLFGPDLKPGDNFSNGLLNEVLDANTAATINEKRNEARAHFLKIRALPINEQYCRNFLKMLP